MMKQVTQGVCLEVQSTISIAFMHVICMQAECESWQSRQAKQMICTTLFLPTNRAGIAGRGGRHAKLSRRFRMESPVAGCTMPRPMRAILSMKPGVRMAMPLPPQAPHCTPVPTLPLIWPHRDLVSNSHTNIGCSSKICCSTALIATMNDNMPSTLWLLEACRHTLLHKTVSQMRWCETSTCKCKLMKREKGQGQRQTRSVMRQNTPKPLTSSS